MDEHIFKKELKLLFISYNRNCVLCHLFTFHKPTVHEIEKSIESHIWVNPLAFNVREHSSIISLSLLCSNFTHRLGVSAAGVLLYTGLPVSVAEPLRVSTAMWKPCSAHPSVVLQLCVFKVMSAHPSLIICVVIPEFFIKPN